MFACTDGTKLQNHKSAEGGRRSVAGILFVYTFMKISQLVQTWDRLTHTHSHTHTLTHTHTHTNGQTKLATVHIKWIMAYV